jgi:hypothetical protein
MTMSRFPARYILIAGAAALSAFGQSGNPKYRLLEGAAYALREYRDDLARSDAD